MAKCRTTNKSLSIKDRYNGIKKTPKEGILETKHKYPRNVFKKSYENKMVIKYALKNERVAKVMERDNTLVFIVDVAATKSEIKKAVVEKYYAPVVKVNTLITFKRHEKKAFVKFAEEGAAVTIAGKAGIL
ncbi:RL23A [Enterospora canceri]|uniref:RL23A n=1 Tax=Enterospora canceri TaxID=1081671 RepID=A0A1Y1S8K5_9MICR|nr:RL23A [Enterospora canceri]